MGVGQLGGSTPTLMKSSVPHERKANLRNRVHGSLHGSWTPLAPAPSVSALGKPAVEHSVMMLDGSSNRQFLVSEDT